jgi:glycosidase
VTCLWLTPIFPSPSHHGYDPIDPGAVEPRLGTLADWDALVAAARARGMRLLVNHVSSAHPRFLAAQADREDPAAAWFRFRDHPHAYDCFFDVPSQPELQTDHPEVRAYCLEHARFWLERGCDGFRLDYAANVSHAFWSLFREGTRRGQGEAVTLGEITKPPMSCALPSAAWMVAWISACWSCCAPSLPSAACPPAPSSTAWSNTWPISASSGSSMAINGACV